MRAPTIDDVIAWTRDHPAFADDIREVAAVALEIADTPPSEPSAADVERHLGLADEYLDRLLKTRPPPPRRAPSRPPPER